jgi:hypothetical protein
VSEMAIWPTIAHNALFHIGTFDPNQKSQTHNTTSLEGNGLSVSLHPEAWREIARLGEEPTWILRHAESQVFLDVRSLVDTHWAAAMAWAFAEQLATHAQIIEVSWHDEDAEARSTMIFDDENPKDQAAAAAEFESQEDSSPKLHRRSAFRATPALNARIGFPVDIACVRDMVMTLYVEDVLHETLGLQGCWWDDELDVYSHSAPRGVIHPKALAGWQRAVFEGDCDEESLLADCVGESISQA